LPLRKCTQSRFAESLDGRYVLQIESLLQGESLLDTIVEL